MNQENEGKGFRSSMPAIAEASFGVGQPVCDEGVYVCVTCKIPGMEASLLPGEDAPPCPRCGDDARWNKT